MHIKFLARGTGSARAAADYLLGARDATGQLREGVEILQGDPHQVAAVALILPQRPASSQITPSHCNRYRATTSGSSAASV